MNAAAHTHLPEAELEASDGAAGLEEPLYCPTLGFLIICNLSKNKLKCVSGDLDGIGVIWP